MLDTYSKLFWVCRSSLKFMETLKQFPCFYELRCARIIKWAGDHLAHGQLGHAQEGIHKGSMFSGQNQNLRSSWHLARPKLHVAFHRQSFSRGAEPSVEPIRVHAWEHKRNGVGPAPRCYKAFGKHVRSSLDGAWDECLNESMNESCQWRGELGERINDWNQVRVLMEGANEKPTMILCHHFDEDLGIHIPVLKSVESWQPPEKSKKASDEAQTCMNSLGCPLIMRRRRILKYQRQSGKRLSIHMWSNKVFDMLGPQRLRSQLQCRAQKNKKLSSARVHRVH